MEALRQRAPLEGEVKDETEAEAGMPREESAIQRDLVRYVDHLNDQFRTGLPEVMRLLEAHDAVDMAQHHSGFDIEFESPK